MAYRTFYLSIVGALISAIVVPLLLLVLPHPANEVAVAATATCVLAPVVLVVMVVLGVRAKRLELDEIEQGYTTLDRPGLGLEVRHDPKHGLDPQSGSVGGRGQRVSSKGEPDRRANFLPVDKTPLDRSGRLLALIAGLYTLVALAASVPLFDAARQETGATFVILTGFDISAAVVVPALLGAVIAGRRSRSEAQLLGKIRAATEFVPINFDDELLAVLYSLADEACKPSFIALTRKLYLVFAGGALEVWAHPWRERAVRLLVRAPAARLTMIRVDSTARPPEVRVVIRDASQHARELKLTFGAAGAFRQKRTSERVADELNRLRDSAS